MRKSPTSVGLFSCSANTVPPPAREEAREITPQTGVKVRCFPLGNFGPVCLNTGLRLYGKATPLSCHPVREENRHEVTDRDARPRRVGDGGRARERAADGRGEATR